MAKPEPVKWHVWYAHGLDNQTDVWAADEKSARRAALAEFRRHRQDVNFWGPETVVEAVRRA